MIRINGLVRLADHVRVEIGRGVTAGKKLKLQAMVVGSINQIISILHRENADERQLPAPSRKAYSYLREIDWNSIALAGAGEAAPNKPTGVRWSGLNGLMQRWLDRLASGPSPAEINAVHQAISQMSGRIETTISRDKLGPDQLTPATRECRGWLAWMRERGNLEEYLRVMNRATGIFQAAATSAGRNLQITLEFRPGKHIYKFKTRGARTRITLPTMMLRVGDETFGDIALMIHRQDKLARKRVIDAMMSEAYGDLTAEIEALEGIAQSARGVIHDLNEVFDRVNKTYFDGVMEKPRLTWSRSMTRRKFGHYNHVRDWVMISSTLDQKQVPAFVVEYLMYHELLHKKHGIRWTNGRGYSHTAGFYEEERRFAEYEQSEQWINKLARG